MVALSTETGRYMLPSVTSLHGLHEDLIGAGVVQIDEGELEIPDA